MCNKNSSKMKIPNDKINTNFFSRLKPYHTVLVKARVLISNIYTRLNSLDVLFLSSILSVYCWVCVCVCVWQVLNYYYYSTHEIACLRPERSWTCYEDHSSMAISWLQTKSTFFLIIFFFVVLARSQHHSYRFYCVSK